MTKKESIKIEKYLLDGYKKPNYKLAEKIMEAVEKRIPKKVTHEASLYKNCTCPNCKNVVDEFTDFAGKRVRVTIQNCKFCGQKLDWSDTDEQNDR